MTTWTFYSDIFKRISKKNKIPRNTEDIRGMRWDHSSSVFTFLFFNCKDLCYIYEYYIIHTQKHVWFNTVINHNEYKHQTECDFVRPKHPYFFLLKHLFRLKMFCHLDLDRRWWHERFKMVYAEIVFSIIICCKTMFCLYQRKNSLSVPTLTCWPLKTSSAISPCFSEGMKCCLHQNRKIK